MVQVYICQSPPPAHRLCPKHVKAPDVSGLSIRNNSKYGCPSEPGEGFPFLFRTTYPAGSVPAMDIVVQPGLSRYAASWGR